MAQAQTGEMAFRMERQERRQGEASSPALEEEVGQGRSAPTGLCGDRGHIPLAHKSLIQGYKTGLSYPD